MKIINVRLAERSYSILIGRSLLSSLGWLMKTLRLGRKVFIVSNRKVAGLFLKKAAASLRKAGYETAPAFLLPFGDERDKSEKVLLSLWQHMAKVGLERSSTVVALGGGVVGDLAGFAAATYMRGLNLVQVPTTLLAQVDSAIGGKTAIDLPAAKNIVGAFYQPRFVICDVETLGKMGLHKEGLAQLRNSFAEVIKYGMIQDARLFRLLERTVKGFLLSASKKPLGKAEYAFLEEVIWRSARVKAEVVEEDEREIRGKRMILNYGHTFAHAFEAEKKYRLPHGEAVALGMVCAVRLAVKRGLCSKDVERRQNHLITSTGLPTRLRPYRFNLPAVLRAMQLDKKKRAGKLHFVLPSAIGKVKILHQISLGEVQEVLREMSLRGR